MQTFWSRFLQENKEMNLNKGTNNPGEDTKKSEKKFSKRRIPVHCGHTWTITQYKGAWRHTDFDNIIKKNLHAFSKLCWKRLVSWQFLKLMSWSYEFIKEKELNDSNSAGEFYENMTGRPMSGRFMYFNLRLLYCLLFQPLIELYYSKSTVDAMFFR